MTRILFVCLGNICRSPAAEGILRDKAEAAGLRIEVDSAGTGGWHVGQAPDPRMIAHAKARGYDLSTLVARQFNASIDLRDFDLILTMDNANFRNVQALDRSNDHKAKIRKTSSFCKVHAVEEVPDPYYKGDDGFDLVLDILEDACGEIIERLKKETSFP